MAETRKLTSLWYFTEDGQAKGPCELPELVRNLSRAPEPGQISIWRPGFTDWQPAEAVPEVFSQLLRPPPVKAARVVSKSSPAAAARVSLPDKVIAFRSEAIAVEHAPSLFRFNGIGTTLLGHYVDKDLIPAFFTVHFFTVFWIPLIPLGIYMVKHPLAEDGRPQGHRYQFLWRIPNNLFRRLYPDGYVELTKTSATQTAMWIGLVIGAIVLIALFKSALRHH